MCKCILLFIALFFPGPAILMDRGCGSDFLATCCLSILFHLPGVIYAYVLLLRKEPPNSVVVVTHVTVPPEYPSRPQTPSEPYEDTQMIYGSTEALVK
ncbi:hypothetical protein COOONC_23149 [Cooperia oncophora]